MMDFSTPPRKSPPETLLPMINVVFLLLIFFLISARMTPPEPFPVTPPQSQVQSQAQAVGGGDFTLYLAADGRIGYAGALGDAALATLAADRDRYCAGQDCTAAPPRLSLRADAAVAAQAVAALLPRLGHLGFGRVDLVAAQGGRP